MTHNCDRLCFTYHSQQKSGTPHLKEEEEKKTLDSWVVVGF